MSAGEFEEPVWPEGHILTWSGKWHYANPAFGDRAFCGAYGYTHFATSNRYEDRALPSRMANHRLNMIATGIRQAAVCKKCEKAREVSRG
jgi:hypothetical protein